MASPAVDYTLNQQWPLLVEQQETVEFLLRRAQAIAALQTGLGKTYTVTTAQTHVFNKYPDKARGITICPVNALKAFRDAYYNKLGYKKHEVGWVTTENVDYDFKKNRVIVISFPVLSRYMDIIREMKQRGYILVSIIDEAHKLQAKDTITKQNLEELRPILDVLWLSTATPLMNDIEGLFNLVNYLKPGFLGTRNEFYKRYIDFKLKDIWVKGGTKRKVRDVQGYKKEAFPELKKRLDNICIMRQLQYNLDYVYLLGDMSEEELSLYSKASAGILSNEERNFGARLHDLQRVVDNSFTSEIVTPKPGDSAKELLMIKGLKAIIKKGFGAIVYADYIDTLERLSGVIKRHKYDIGYRNLYTISGAIKPKERREIEEHLAAGDIVLITSAGSESLNLQGVNCVMFYDIPFSVGRILQTIGRVTRLDTKYDKLFVFVVGMRDTIDEYKYLLFLDNAKLIKDLIGSDANMPIVLSEIDRKNLDKLKEKYLWHYKDNERKMKAREKKLLKNNIQICDSSNYTEAVCSFMIDLNPASQERVPGSKRSKVITPNQSAYDLVIRNRDLYTIFKNKYIDQLRQEDTMGFIAVLKNEVLNGKVVALVDDYEVGKIVKDFILSSLS